MGTLVQEHSTVGGAAGSKTETFSAATAGNLLIIICATNENGGADNITTPAGWTLLGTFRQGTTHVNMAFFGKIAAGGETSQAISTSAATQRMQTWFGEFSGYSINLDGSISTAGSSSAVTTGDTGTTTPSQSGRLWIGAIGAKNREASFTEVGGMTPATVNNEVTGANSTQLLTMGVWYDLNRSTAAREQATWSTNAAQFAGIGLLLRQPPLITAVSRGSSSGIANVTVTHAGITFVQTKAAGANGVSTAISTSGFASTIPVGHTVFVLAYWNSLGDPIVDVSDNSSQSGSANTYVLDKQVNNGSDSLYVFRCNVTRNILTTDSISITFPGGAYSRRTIQILEFSGFSGGAALDVSATNTGTTSPLSPGTTATTTTAVELALAAYGIKTDTLTTSGFADATSGWVAKTGANSGAGTINSNIDASYKILASTGTQTDAPTATNVISSYNASIQTYKAVGGTGTQWVITAVSNGTSSGIAVVTVTSPSSYATPAYVREQAAGTSTAAASTTLAVTLAQSVAAGNSLIFAIGARESTATISSVSDPRSNTWRIDGAIGNASGNTASMIAHVYATNAYTAGDVITFTFSASIGTGRVWWLEEFSGLDNLAHDIVATAAMAAGSPATVTGGPSVLAKELWVAVTASDDVANGYTQASGFSSFTTGEQNVAGTNPRRGIAGYKVTTSTGSQTYTVGGSTTNSPVILVSFKAKPASGTNWPITAISNSRSYVSTARVGTHYYLGASVSQMFSSGIAKVLSVTSITAVSRSSSSGVCKVVRTRNLNAYSFCASTGVARLTRTRTLTSISTGSSTGICSIARNRIFACVSTNTSSGVVTLSRLRRLTSVSTGSSSGIASILKARILIAVSTGSSTGLCLFVRTRNLVGVSNGSSSGVCSIVRSRRLTAISSPVSGISTCSLTRNRITSCVSNGSSTGTCVLVRNRRFAALSSGASTGIVTSLGSNAKNLIAISSGTSDSTTKIVRNRSISFYSTMVASGATVNLISPVFLTVVSTGSSSGVAKLVRTRTFAVTSNGSSSGVCNVLKTRGLVSISSGGSSSGVCSIARGRVIKCVSTGTSSGNAIISRNKKIAAYSSGSSTGVLNLYQAKYCGSFSPLNTSYPALVNFAINHKLTAVSSGSSSGRLYLVNIATSFYVSRGSSSGVTQMTRVRGIVGLSNDNSTASAVSSRNHTFAAISGGSSTGLCTVLKTRGLVCRSTGSSSAVTNIIRTRRLVAVSVSTADSQGFIRIVGTHDYLIRGFSTGVGGLAVAHNIAAISIGSSDSSCAIARDYGLAAVAEGDSSGLAQVPNNPGLIVVSEGDSSGECTFAPVAFVSFYSDSSSTGIFNLAVDHLLSAISVSTSSSTCFVSTVGEHASIGTGTSTGIAKIVCKRGIVGISNDLSRATCANINLNRGIHCVSHSTSSLTAHVSGTVRFGAVMSSASGGIVRIGLTTRFSATSSGRSTGNVSITDVNQYGTIKIWDNVTYRLEVWDLNATEKIWDR